MVRKITIEAFGMWIEREENVQQVLDMVADGVTLQKVSVELKKPYRCLHEFVHRPEVVARYEAARKAWADSKMDEALEIADGVVADKDEVAKASLRVKTRENQAKAYHRERWGEKVEHDVGRRDVVDAAFLGTASELLKLIRAKHEPRVIESEPVPLALPVKAA